MFLAITISIYAILLSSIAFLVVASLLIRKFRHESRQKVHNLRNENSSESKNTKHLNQINQINNLRDNMNSFLNPDSDVESCRLGAKLDLGYNSAPKTII